MLQNVGWKVMNEQIRTNRFFKSAKDFREAVNSFFDESASRQSNGFAGSGLPRYGSMCVKH